MSNQELGHTREQTQEAHQLARECVPASQVEDLLPKEDGMVTILSMVDRSQQKYVSETYQSVAVEIDGKKFMLNPRQLVPKRARILTSKVRANDDGDGNKKPVPAGFGGVAGGVI